MFCCSPFVCTLVMVSVGIFTSGGNFELDLTSYKQYLFYKFITAVVSTTALSYVW